MLRDLYRQGLSISEIARQTGYNRRTVSKYVNAEVPPISRKPSAKPSKLDSYKDYIIQRLNSGPLTACRIYQFTLSIDTPTLIQCHLNAFNFFGGYPEEVLYDNMKQIVIKRTMKSSDSEWNTQFESSDKGQDREYSWLCEARLLSGQLF